MPDLNIFSERLKEARQKAKLTQKQLAGLSDVTAATISSYESEGGTKVPSLDKVIALAKALNVSLDWLCGLEEKPKDYKNNKEIGFDEVMKAIILLSNFNKANLAIDDVPFGDNCTISFYDEIIKAFVSEYLKIQDFIKNADYPQYLKDGLLQALINKFSNYIVLNGEVVDIDCIIADGDIPF